MYVHTFFLLKSYCYGYTNDYYTMTFGTTVEEKRESYIG